MSYFLSILAGHDVSHLVGWCLTACWSQSVAASSGGSNSQSRRCALMIQHIMWWLPPRRHRLEPAGFCRNPGLLLCTLIPPPSSVRSVSGDSPGQEVAHRWIHFRWCASVWARVHVCVWGACGSVASIGQSVLGARAHDLPPNIRVPRDVSWVAGSRNAAEQGAACCVGDIASTPLPKGCVECSSDACRWPRRGG